jgi:hypothetical protein
VLLFLVDDRVLVCVFLSVCFSDTLYYTSGGDSGHNLDPMIAVPCSEHMNAQRRLQHNKSCIYKCFKRYHGAWVSLWQRPKCPLGRGRDTIWTERRTSTATMG